MSYLGEDAVYNFIVFDWICDPVYVESDVKVKHHCHITVKYRGSGDRNCSINIKFHHKVPIVFKNLTNYDSHLMM